MRNDKELVSRAIDNYPMALQFSNDRLKDGKSDCIHLLYNCLCGFQFNMQIFCN